jgi:hypothetical protein
MQQVMLSFSYVVERQVMLRWRMSTPGGIGTDQDPNMQSADRIPSLSIPIHTSSWVSVV